MMIRSSVVHNHQVLNIHIEVSEGTEDSIKQAEFHEAQDTFDTDKFDISRPISLIEANMNNVRGYPRPVQTEYNK